MSPASTRPTLWASASRTSWCASDLGENQYGHWLGFALLTLVPIDTTPVLVDELSRDQITWLNDYHAHVYEMPSPRLTEDEKGVAEE